MFLSSLLLTSSTLLSPPNTPLSPPPAYAADSGLTWASSPVNKRSGVTVFQAEKAGYNVRFITYLARFLISFDEECQRWWFTRATDIPRLSSREKVDEYRLKQFGSFSASVEVGLQEYQTADGPERLMKALIKRYCPAMDDVNANRELRGLPPLKPQEETQRETAINESRRQIALLFGLLEKNQPVEYITQTLAGIDNATIFKVEVVNPGTGYAPGYGAPLVTFPTPLAGENYQKATGRAVLRPNGRILRIDVRKRGLGYNSNKSPPVVKISPPLAAELGAPKSEAYSATAKATLFRDGLNKGRIARIELTDPGKGYKQDEPIVVMIEPYDASYADGGERAYAEVVLEYEVGEIEIVDSGGGYVADQPLEIRVDPPPLTARVNMNDPMMVKFIGEAGQAAAFRSNNVYTNTLKGGKGKKLPSPESEPVVKNDRNNDSIYDPASFSEKIWNQAKLASSNIVQSSSDNPSPSKSSPCVGRACYDTPVVAYAYAKAQRDVFYTLFDTNEDKLKEEETEYDSKVLGTTSSSSSSDSGGESSPTVMPFYFASGGMAMPSSSSRQLLTLLPSGVGLEFNEDLKRYKLALGRDVEDLQYSTVAAGKPMDPDFGPRGRSPIEREKDLDLSTFLRFSLSGAVCCSAVHLALTPLDVMKTKVQTDPKKHTDFFTSFKILSKDGGIASFFVGWAPTFIGFFVNGAIAYSFTEFFRRYYTELAGEAVAGNFEVLIILLAASTSAFIGAFLLAPSETIRIRCVAQPDYAPNVIEVTKRIIREEGLKSLWSAVPIFLLKEIPFSMAKFTVFDLSTTYLYEEFPVAREDIQLSLLVSLVGGTLGGMSAAFVSNPADATISEMKKNKSGLGPFDTVKTVINRDGTLGLFRGLDIRLFFYSLLVSLQFLLYDAVRIGLGIGSDDLKLFLDVLGGALKESGGPV